MGLLDVMHVCEPKENISSSSLNVVGKNLILPDRHWTKTREPGLMATGTVASDALPAVKRNGLSEN